MSWITDAAAAIGIGMLDHLLGLAAAAAVALITYAVQYATRRWEWADALISEERVQEEVESAVRYVQRHAEEYASKRGKRELEFPDYVEQAVEIIAERVPEAMRRAGLTRDAVRGWVEDALD